MIRNLFSGEGSLGYNALYDALHDCAADDGLADEYGAYEYLAKTPRTSLVVELVDKLRESGYDIVKK